MEVTAPITERDVLDVVGDVDPLVMARLVAIRPSRAELEAAVEADADERGFGEALHSPASTRIAEVRAVLDELAAAETDDDEARATL